MTIDYKLVNGPGRDDLLLGLSEQKYLSFRGYNEKEGTHIFEVCVRTLTLVETGDEKLGWTVKGLILEKDGRELLDNGKLKTYSAVFDARKRQGHFNEEDAVQHNSFEYFDGLSDDELQKKIAKLRAGIPRDLQDLEDFTASLKTHDKLVIEAVHVWGLSCASIHPKMDYEFHKIFRGKGLEGSRSRCLT